MQTKDIITISVGDCLYPDIFMQLRHPPATLYACGNINLLASKPLLGIVGTRRATAYGKEVTNDLSRKLAANGAVIVSGLAYGIDSIAHQGALDVGGETIAVLPGSLDNVYPRAHYGLAQAIVDNHGLLLTEHRDRVPEKYDFVERNRLIAALSDVLLITEAADKSGTFHTIKYAQKLNKVIAVVPGNITSPMSKGVNKLFFDGAQPILESADLLSLLGLHEKVMKPKYEGQNSFENIVLSLLRKQSLSTNNIMELSGLDASSVNTHITMLEIKGIIEQINGSTWKLIK